MLKKKKDKKIPDGISSDNRRIENNDSKRIDIVLHTQQCLQLTSFNL